ncbi:MAG: twin-arginine translocase subunit TatC [Deltaproteobacteria bacterium]|nr:twin-arginine translocase subunit TatC [Deltaproteobacteria bacterium]RLB92308.1 MAG: twin-arginine translocase subunit TatC [Deltaproteobacteria bacterium]RLC12403.1 MAG: twin-arginine translocase subunit TatC [Deltaproteobacteria bacterium]
MPEEEKLPFTAHLEELRKRLIICFSAIGVGFVVCYVFSKKLFELLMLPLLKAMPPEEKLIYTGLPEAFFTYLKVAFFAGILLAIPVIMYQLWMFIAPGLYDKEKRLALPVVFLSSLFFVGGALFGYFVVFPFGFKFFMGFSSEYIRPLPSMKEYLSFSVKLLFAFGVVFELPLFVTFLAKLGIVNVSFLRAKRKYAILLFFVFAAILTPPDVITQVMMAGPLILLYEISIFGAKIFGKKEPQVSTKETKETSG